jgi:hypothetical protein
MVASEMSGHCGRSTPGRIAATPCGTLYLPSLMARPMQHLVMAHLSHERAPCRGSRTIRCHTPHLMAQWWCIMSEWGTPRGINGTHFTNCKKYVTSKADASFSTLPLKSWGAIPPTTASGGLWERELAPSPVMGGGGVLLWLVALAGCFGLFSWFVRGVFFWGGGGCWPLAATSRTCAANRTCAHAQRAVSRSPKSAVFPPSSCQNCPPDRLPFVGKQACALVPCALVPKYTSTGANSHLGRHKAALGALLRDA